MTERREYETRAKIENLRSEAADLESRVARKEARDDCHRVVNGLMAPVWVAMAQSHAEGCTRDPCACHMKLVEEALNTFEREFDARFPFGADL